jgi:actin-related protein
LLSGFNDRLKYELEKIAPTYIQKITVHESKCANNLGAWIGGSTLASLESFYGQYVEREEYDKNRSTIGDRLGGAW